MQLEVVSATLFNTASSYLSFNVFRPSHSGKLFNNKSYATFTVGCQSRKAVIIEPSLDSESRQQDIFVDNCEYGYKDAVRI